MERVFRCSGCSWRSFEVNMFRDFSKFNQHGMVIPVSIGYQRSQFENVSKEYATEYMNAYSKEGLFWFYNNKRVLLEDQYSTIYGYPNVDQNYVIVIYKDQNDQFSMPNNAVVYNLDGSIHRSLEMPKLISPKILDNIQQEGHSNPPIEDKRYGHYGMGLQFAGFSWNKDQDGNLYNAISIQYAGEYGEWRVLNPENGTFGELVDDWYQSYGWR